MAQSLDVDSSAVAATEAPEQAFVPTPPPSSWRSRVRIGMIASDSLIVVVCVAAGQLLRFGVGYQGITGTAGLSYTALSIAVMATWLLAMAIAGAWHPKIFLSGTPGYGRIIKASFTVFGLVAVVAYLGKWEIARGYVAIAIPLGMTALLIARASWRACLLALRRRGAMMQPTLIVGGEFTAVALAKQFRESPLAGYHVVGLCLPNDYQDDAVDEIPVVGTFESIVDTAHRVGASVIAVAKTDKFSPEQLRKLSWSLEHTNLSLIVAPMLTDITGPRIHASPVPGMELVHLERPRLSGPQLWLKATFDYIAASIGLVIASPIFVAVAVAIKLDDGGPVFFRQQRVGLAQKPFKIWKFRTMRVGADALHREIAAHSAVFTKSHKPADLTRIGNFLRRSSIDELPQMLNVLAGQMSLVGPRPLVPWEGTTIAGYIQRRTLVKPGITGLWQISGRSETSGARAADLDLLYVENWSILGDVYLIFRSVRAVLSSHGAR